MVGHNFKFCVSRDTVVSRDEFTILYMYSVAKPDHVSLREPASCEPVITESQ